MARMRAAEAAIRTMEREGVDVAFGVPGAAIPPLYDLPVGKAVPAK